MTERVFIRWPKQQQDPVDWGILAEQAPEFSQLGQLESLADLSELQSACQSRPVVVILPSALVHFCAADMPSRQLRHVQKAIPFALEEQLAEDIDDLHFALPARLASQGKIPVVVLRREWLQQILEQLQQADIQPIALIPDLLLLADTDDWTLLADPQEFWLRRPGLQGMTASGSLQALLWQRLCAQQAEQLPARIRLQVTSPEVAEYWQQQIPAGIEVQVELIGHPLEWLAKGYSPASFNLLQGQYAVKDQVSRYWQPWQTSAWLLGALVFCFLVVTEIERQSLLKQQAQVRADISQQLRQHFPAISRVVNLKSQVSRELKALAGSGGQDGFLTLLQHTTQGFASQPDIRPTAINFDAKDNQLRLDLNAKDYAGLQALQQTLHKAEFSAELNSANAKDQGFVGRLVLSFASDEPAKGSKRK